MVTLAKTSIANKYPTQDKAKGSMSDPVSCSKIMCASNRSLSISSEIGSFGSWEWVKRHMLEEVEMTSWVGIYVHSFDVSSYSITKGNSRVYVLSSNHRETRDVVSCVAVQLLANKAECSRAQCFTTQPSNPHTLPCLQTHPEWFLEFRQLQHRHFYRTTWSLSLGVIALSCLQSLIRWSEPPVTSDTHHGSLVKVKTIPNGFWLSRKNTKAVPLRLLR